MGLLTLLCRHGGSVCVSDLIYPGLKAIASQLNITLQSLPCDEDGRCRARLNISARPAIFARSTSTRRSRTPPP
ncbi:hypothetical protein OVX87_29310 [Klebsiella pneumoniae]|nr:hypothetical protein [Klebsiella pneumoniae]